MLIQPKIMFEAAALKIAIMTKGISIPNYLKANPALEKLDKADLNYIIGQGKKLLIAMNRR